jgi:hypothetical protein
MPAMKRCMLLLSLFLLATVSSQAQTFNDVFDKKTEITWLGLDFTGTKIIGDKETWAKHDPIQLFEAWNQLMIKERDKYNVAEALHRDQVKQALEITMNHNSALNVTDLFADVTSNQFKLTPDIIQTIVESYSFKGYSGIGIMFVVETLDKTMAEGALFVTFINLNTKEVLFTERMTGEPGGFGLRNYWAGSVYNILKRIKSTEYRSWQKKYSTSKKK